MRNSPPSVVAVTLVMLAPPNFRVARSLVRMVTPVAMEEPAVWVAMGGRLMRIGSFSSLPVAL
jgi:hypothetical protein